MVGEGEPVAGVGVIHPLDELSESADEVVGLLGPGGSLALGLDDESFAVAAGVDVDASFPTPSDGHGPAVGFEVGLDGTSSSVVRSPAAAVGAWSGVGSGGW